jgi:thioredoxin-related protein
MRAPSNAGGHDVRPPVHALRAVLVALLAFAAQPAAAAEGLNPSPHAIDIPPWFRETFLDFREDVREAAKEKKRLLVYFGQDGCPYCRELMRVNFADKALADRMRRHFYAIAINIRGDREVVWSDGRVLTEKMLAAFLKVQFTPTLLFFDEKGAIALRINGYYPPHRFDAALDYVASGAYRSEPSFQRFIQRRAERIRAAGGRVELW